MKELAINIMVWSVANLGAGDLRVHDAASCRHPLQSSLVEDPLIERDRKIDRQIRKEGKKKNQKRSRK